ncbi:MAG: hypothetical protein ACYC66_03925 [Chloroflexota bacterium]
MSEASESEGEDPPPGHGAQLTASDIVYLHSDFFLSQRTRAKGGFSQEPSGPEGRKQRLAHTMTLAALASLMKEGWIELVVVNVGVYLTSSAPVLRRASPEPYPGGGLEATLISSLKAVDRLNTVEQVIRRAIGRGQSNPWDRVLTCAREHLTEILQAREPRKDAAEMGLRESPSTYSFEPDLALISESLKDAYRVQSILMEVRAVQPWNWELASGQVEQALRASQSGTGDAD